MSAITGKLSIMEISDLDIVYRWSSIKLKFGQVLIIPLIKIIEKYKY